MNTPNPEQPAPTPRTDAFCHEPVRYEGAGKSPTDCRLMGWERFARQLERELNAAHKEIGEYSKLLAKRTQDFIGWDGPGAPLPPSVSAKQPVPDAGVREAEQGNDMTTAEIPAAARGHSPLPWKVQTANESANKVPKIIREGKSGFIASMGYAGEGDREANAELIVHAVNSLLSSRKPVSEPSPAPTPATSDDTLLLNWLEANGALLNDVQGGHVSIINRRDERGVAGANEGDISHFYGDTYRQALRAAMADAGEQKT